MKSIVHDNLRYKFFTKFNIYLYCFSLLVVVAGCQSSVEPINIEPTRDIKVTEVPATSTEQVSSFPPPELIESFDTNFCSDYCWHGIQLGDSEADVLQAIRNDPWTDTTLKTWGDYVEIQTGDWGGETYIDIAWDIVIPDRTVTNSAHVQIINDSADSLLVPIRERFPVQLVLDFFGEPEYISVPNTGTDSPLEKEEAPKPFYYLIAYPQERVMFKVRAIGEENPSILAESLVEAVRFYSNSPDFECLAYMYFWEGYGGDPIYPVLYHMQPLREVPQQCND